MYIWYPKIETTAVPKIAPVNIKIFFVFGVI